MQNPWDVHVSGLAATSGPTGEQPAALRLRWRVFPISGGITGQRARVPGAGTGEGPEHVSAGAGAAFCEAAARVCADIRAELGDSAAELAFFDSGSAFQGEQARSILAFSSLGVGQPGEVGSAGNEAGDSAVFYEFLRRELARVEVSEDFPRELTGGFALGWVGAFGYELKGLSADVRDSATALPTPLRHPSHPDAALIFADRGLVFSPADGAVIALALESAAGVGAGQDVIAALGPNAEQYASAKRWFAHLEHRYGEGLERLFTGAVHPPATHFPAAQSNSTHFPAAQSQPAPLEFRLDHGREAYLNNVAACQDHIAAGDSYELCLTTTARGPALADPWAAYQRLRTTSPVPYGAYLQFGGRGLCLLSASPERFLRVLRSAAAGAGGNLVVEAKPIKGTRPRGEGAEDARWRRELENSEKDRAENLMIVDLLRNDLAKICQPGSVRVPRLFAVESYSHVHQLVSTITGELRPTADAVAALAACFPGGSMTGAPKVRSMELLEALEGSARGLYSGAIGWLSPTGEADLSITIRTLVDDRHGSSFGVGGAIVADSDPEAEWQEILVKASALLEALGARILNSGTERST